MQSLLRGHRRGFSKKWTDITTIDDVTGIAFAILQLNEAKKLQLPHEVALLQLNGSLEVMLDGKTYANTRDSLFDSPPFAIHAPPHTFIELNGDAELAVMQTKNENAFAPRVLDQTDNEHRGEGLLDNSMLRYVRTIFDNRNSDEKANLVLGEVVNFPGKWSSYPPHHHPQPEIYHYRFTDPKGFGHAELGDEVFRVHPFDTLRILDEKEHAQCAAPGYGMYYAWVIRHLPNLKYTVPIFHEDHKWTMQAGAKAWAPRETATP